MPSSQVESRGCCGRHTERRRRAPAHERSEGPRRRRRCRRPHDQRRPTVDHAVPDCARRVVAWVVGAHDLARKSVGQLAQVTQFHRLRPFYTTRHNQVMSTTTMPMSPPLFADRPGNPRRTHRKPQSPRARVLPRMTPDAFIATTGDRPCGDSLGLLHLRRVHPPLLGTRCGRSYRSLPLAIPGDPQGRGDPLANREAVRDHFAKAISAYRVTSGVLTWTPVEIEAHNSASVRISRPCTGTRSMGMTRCSETPGRATNCSPLRTAGASSRTRTTFKAVAGRVFANDARARSGRQPICSASPMRMPSGPRT